MKLLYCHVCGDIRKLGENPTDCACGIVTACYTDDIHATWNGQGLILGINNTGFRNARRGYFSARNRGEQHDGPSPFRMEAWIMYDNPNIIIDPEIGQPVFYQNSPEGGNWYVPDPDRPGHLMVRM